jgi:hypothetical protein
LPLILPICSRYIHKVNCKHKTLQWFEGIPSHLNYVMWNLEEWPATWDCVRWKWHHCANLVYVSMIMRRFLLRHKWVMADNKVQIEARSQNVTQIVISLTDNNDWKIRGCGRLQLYWDVTLMIGLQVSTTMSN